ncbi:MAG: SAM-dependent methyltransferase, partial [Parabacteroides sp.]|nr:SAM-dependent methyltransferase [Parabacteroides sp.]
DLLPGTTAVYVLSVKNECKELLFVVERVATIEEPTIHCVNFMSEGKESVFSFTLGDEHRAETLKSDGVGDYLYEPNASVLKAGAFKQVALRYGVRKLHINSHLYTSEKLITDFPGRIFRIDEVHAFSGKLCKGLSKIIPQANITVRNFPLTVEELRKRTKVRDGGDVYLFATTLANGDKVLIQCAKCS